MKFFVVFLAVGIATAVALPQSTEPDISCVVAYFATKLEQYQGIFQYFLDLKFLLKFICVIDMIKGKNCSVTEVLDDFAEVLDALKAEDSDKLNAAVRKFDLTLQNLPADLKQTLGSDHVKETLPELNVGVKPSYDLFMNEAFPVIGKIGWLASNCFTASS